MTDESHVSPEVLAMFAESGFDPISVAVAGLATVRMDARFQVVEVSLEDRAAERKQVEVALREAFNEALRQVARRNSARLSELMTTEGKDDPAAP
jgi:DNA-binding protein YbaB